MVSEVKEQEFVKVYSFRRIIYDWILWLKFVKKNVVFLSTYIIRYQETGHLTPSTDLIGGDKKWKERIDSDKNFFFLYLVQSHLLLPTNE